MTNDNGHDNALDYVRAITRRIQDGTLVVLPENARNILDILDELEKQKLATPEETGELRALLTERL